MEAPEAHAVCGFRIGGPEGLPERVQRAPGADRGIPLQTGTCVHKTEDSKTRQHIIFRVTDADVLVFKFVTASRSSGRFDIAEFSAFATARSHPLSRGARKIVGDYNLRRIQFRIMCHTC